MVFSKKPITKYITWAIVTSQIPLPVIADSDNEIQSWIAGTASSISPHLQEGTLEDYAKGKIKALPGQAANHLVNEGIKSAFPEIIFRGGVNLEDGAKYRSSEFDMFFPVQETTSSLLFGQLGFRDHDSSSFDGRTYVNVGMGYRQEVNGWLLGVNTFLDADIRYSHLRGGIGGKFIKTVWPFPATIISLSPAGKRQQFMNYMMSVRHMALICEQKARFPIFPGSVASSHMNSITGIKLIYWVTVH